MKGQGAQWQGCETQSTFWREFTSTSSATVNYTFAERGLYTIVVAARDVATTEAHSCKETHTFKVRIY
jgi:hypothetical protein